MTAYETNRLLSRAIALQKSGRRPDAVALYREVLRHDPKLFEAHRNLGRALDSLDQFEEAVRCYERAVRLRPRDPEVHADLAHALERLGRGGEAIDHLAVAYVEGPDDARNRARLLGTITGAPSLRVSAPLRRALDVLADDETVRHQGLVPAVAALLTGEAPVAHALRRIADGGELTGRELGPGLYGALSEAIVLRLLTECVFADTRIESLLTGLRRALLAAVVSGTKLRWPPDALLAAIALQALTTEWVWDETADERDQLARVTGAAPSRALFVYALYRPLHPFVEDPALTALAESATGSELLRRHLTDPARERALAEQLPRLTAVKNDVSKRVRSQYEERPYPRWQSLPRRDARPTGEVLAMTLRDPDLARDIDLPGPRVLIAGCGTGRHAVATATRFAGATVLAVDLSLASLGFAARQAEDLDVANLSFAQADILGLTGFPERFDIVECTGVLHHMEEPEAGWRVLRGLVAPGGLMRIGLYSERGRAVIDSIRAVIAERGLEPTEEGIRAARAAIRSFPDDDLVRHLEKSPDFHAMSGCRDLFFPAHESRFDLPRIGRTLESLGLEFLGFELPDERVRDLYRRNFPHDPGARDLTNWDRLESGIPNLFTAMYAFWCRAIK